MLIKVIYVLCLLCVYSSGKNVQMMEGTEDKLSQFPSTVSINIYYAGGIMHFCGASIVDKQWIVTVAQCLRDLLLYANLTALTEDGCERLAEGDTYNIQRGPAQVCAFGGNGTSPCYGDSGSLLVCDDKLVGMVSYAIAPCAKGYPDVYTRTVYYVDWIKTTINNN